MPYDAIIVGGGPAGLSAALVLARCRRRIVIIDSGKPRNRASRELHNFITRDGIRPGRLLELARRELATYRVRIISSTVTAARSTRSGFSVRLNGRTLQSRTLLLATGVADELPDIPGAADLYGRGVFHCPYCDAWPHQGRPIAAYGRGRAAFGLALGLLTWSRRITILTNGGRMPPIAAAKAAKLKIAVRTERIDRLDRIGPRALRIHFKSGPALRASALFFNTDKFQRSNLPLSLGCRIAEDGGVIHNRKQHTGIPGLYLAGDASFDVQFAIVAAAEGAEAAVAINRQLQDWDRRAELLRAARPAGSTPRPRA